MDLWVFNWFWIISFRVCGCNYSYFPQKMFKYRIFQENSNILYSLACGALIGDALIHIIPDAYAN